MVFNPLLTSFVQFSEERGERGTRARPRLMGRQSVGHRYLRRLFSWIYAINILSIQVLFSVGGHNQTKMHIFDGFIQAIIQQQHIKTPATISFSHSTHSSQAMSWGDVTLARESQWAVPVVAWDV